MSGSRSILEDFFDAENRRDWDAYETFLDPQVEWMVGGRTVRGRDAYVAVIRAAYERAGAVSFRLHQVLESDDDRVVATLLVDSTGARSLDVFELADGLVRREWEFELGPGADWNGEAACANGATGEGRSCRVVLTGQLRCADDAQAATVRRHLPRHIELTRAEPGCLSFEVTQSADPLVWQVEEVFTDQAAFDTHQKRVSDSQWGRETQGIERRYTIR